LKKYFEMSESNSEWVNGLKVAALRTELMARGQLATGLKDILLARLIEVRTSILT
jgi:hypothetical protein